MKFIALKSMLVILIITGFAISGTGQNYRNICSPGTTFFKDTAGNFLAFRQDSVYVLPGQDTVFISYRTIIDESYYYPCFDTTNGSILGGRIYEKADGTFLFFNYSHDTLTIRSHAPLNATWKFCNLANNGRVEAKVTSIGIDSVPGGTDSVKTISFQAKNASGNNVSYYLNQLTIKLSKHYGFTNMLDMYHINDTIFWYNATMYSLAGKTTPVMGIQPFGWADVYYFQVGDIFHYHGFQHNNGYGPEWWQIQQVISKTVSSNGDTLTYQFDNCKLTNNPWPTPHVEKIYDTISTTIILSTLDSGISIYRLPMEFYRIGESYDSHAAAYLRTTDYNGRMVQSIDDYAYDTQDDTCWGYVFEGMYAPEYYSPGLGQTGYITEWFESPVMYDWENHLVYFEKGSETWGTPVSQDCSTLLGEKQVTGSNDIPVMVTPNPVDQSAMITVPGIMEGQQITVIMYDELGNKVLRQQLHSPLYVFNRNDLPVGLYFVVLTDEKGTVIGTSKMLLR